MIRLLPRSTLFPYTTLFRSVLFLREMRLLVFFQERHSVSDRDAEAGRRLRTHQDGLIDADHLDRKSTRLNSSHSQISYAVFCLKKKKNNKVFIVSDGGKDHG